MSVGGRPTDRLLASYADQLDLFALVRPVTLEVLSVAHRAAQGQRASKQLALAFLEVLAVVTVLKSCRTGRAVEGKFIEHVGDEPVGLAAGRVDGSTIRAVVMLAGPVGYAGLAVQLVTLPALHHILRYHAQADRAREKCVERLVDSLVWGKAKVSRILRFLRGVK